MYSAKDFTWGCEFELSDVPRSREVPKHLGSWEYSERDIVNTRKPYKNVAADPLGVDPPVGGEINVVPTRTVKGQVDKLQELLEVFPEANVGCLMAFHVHVGCPKLVHDIEGLKALIRYVGKNQDDVIKLCGQYKEEPLMSETKTARTYLKYDLGRRVPEWLVDNLQNADDLEDYIRLYSSGKDSQTRCRPVRHVVNTYCLKHTQTVEFRCFRASLDLDLISNCFRFVRLFMLSALNGGPSVKSIVSKHRLEFPPFWYDHEQYLGWEKTKYGEGRGKKKRTFIEVD